MAFNSGDQVFFKHPKHSWVLGNVTGGSKDNWVCKANDAERQCTGETLDKLKDDDVTNCREDLLDETPNDLLSLTVLHDATLLRCLYLRYFKDIIYTNIGAIVVALNPFNFKIPWYQDDKMAEYLKEGAVIENNLPHSWAQAHNTYNEMMADGMNQCILISGESGAGKTEATKIVMKYLAQISCQRGSAEEKAAGLQVGAKLSSCSPILESFGNARTVRNDNSSRFGKFMKVKFSPQGQLIGAHTTKYLLEKSRIVTAAENERVYHAFYLVVRSSLAGQMGLEGDSAYKSINAGKCLHNSEFDTLDHFKEVADAMANIGMKSEEIESIWACTGGILSMLNVSFVNDGEGSKIDPSTQKYLDTTVKLFKVDGAKLAKEFVINTMVVRGTATEKLLTPTSAQDVRDATAKATYNGMFGWLVEKSNELCDTSAGVGNWIGLLDIFGFEDFQHNSFEQLCINLANETLQNHYNTYIFEKDMDECRKEGIDVTEVKCPDNSPCLKLITDPKQGVLAHLDSECLLGQGSDINFLEKVDSASNKNPFYSKKKTSRNHFIIHHYAANVEYDVTGWLDKNRDTLKDDIKLIMRDSSDSLIKQFLDAPIPQEQRKGRNLTVGGFFKDQVLLLMEVINSTNPHWIRCVKPHPAKKAKMFDGVQTMNQLESSGVLGTVKIRKAGYPVRTLYEKFRIRYQIIIGDKIKQAKTPKDIADFILQACGMKDKKYAQLGKTKVFMKSEAFPMIERKRNEFLLGHAMKLQRSGRGLLDRIKANKTRCALVQQRLSEQLIEEYRWYLKRSKAIREERARLRKEAEMKFRGLRREVEDEAEAAYGSLHQEYEQLISQMIRETDKKLVAEKERMEAMRSQRETFMRQEYLARMRLFEDACSNVAYMTDLYQQEVMLFMETELSFIEDREESARNKRMNEEKEERNKLWRSYIQMQSQRKLVGMNDYAMQSRQLMIHLEAMQREEIHSRFAIKRKEQIMRIHYAKQNKLDLVEVREIEKKRRAFDAHRDQQIFHLEQLRRDEQYRLDLARSAAKRPISTMGWEEAAASTEPRGGVSPPANPLHQYSSVRRDVHPQPPPAAPRAPYVDPASHLLQRANEIIGTPNRSVLQPPATQFTSPYAQQSPHIHANAGTPHRVEPYAYPGASPHNPLTPQNTAPSPSPGRAMRWR